jgi:hypothetical protein
MGGSNSKFRGCLGDRESRINTMNSIAARIIKGKNTYFSLRIFREILYVFVIKGKLFFVGT